MKNVVTLNKDEFMEALECGLQDVGLMTGYTPVTNLEITPENEYKVTMESESE